MITPALQRYFDACGKSGPQPTANAEKVRRIVHLVAALAPRPLAELRILDLATGHGTYALECGLQGAHLVLGLDARVERMNQAAAIAWELGLTNVTFRPADVRTVNRDTYGRWDVILFLGILYHLDAPECCEVLTRLSEMAPLLLIDTFVGAPKEHFQYAGQTYHGMRAREHRATDSAATKQRRQRASYGNDVSWYWEPASLWRFLTTLGYNVLLEARAPLEPQKPPNRVTLACLRTPVVPIHIYPWIAPGGGPP